MTKAKEKYFFFQKGTPGPPENDKTTILEILKNKKSHFLKKILHQIKQVKKTDSPKITKKLT